VGHIVSNLVDYNTLVADAQTVLDTLVPKDTQVQTMTGVWYTMSIRPYRTLENVIEGAVISFVDITNIKRTEDTLAKANTLLRLAVVVRDAHDAITVQDLDGHTLAWNPGAEKMYGWSEAEALRMNVQDRIPDPLKKDALTKIRQLTQAEILEPYRTQRISKNGAVVEIWMTATALMNEAEQMYAIATTKAVAVIQISTRRCASGPKRCSERDPRNSRTTSRPYHPKPHSKRCTSCMCTRSSWRCRTKSCAWHTRHWMKNARNISTSMTWRRSAIARSANRG